jgi:hypothetical protein
MDTDNNKPKSIRFSALSSDLAEEEHLHFYQRKHPKILGVLCFYQSGRRDLNSMR